MSDYFVIEQELLTLDRPLTLGELPEYLDPFDFINGIQVQLSQDIVELNLRETSGDFCPDMITYLIPLFSNKIKAALSELGVDNIDYYPARLKHPQTGQVFEDYWLANIIGCIECLDPENSDATYDDVLKSYKFTSFVVDKSKIGDARMFRLAEKSDLILIDKALKEELEKLDLKSVSIVNTEEYYY